MALTIMETRKPSKRSLKRKVDVTDLTEINGHSENRKMKVGGHRPVVTRSKTKRGDDEPIEDQKMLLTYPPNSGHRAVVSLVASDIETLSHDQFLNDQVVDFWLQHLYREKLSEEDRTKCHVFSSYFFNSLQMARSLNKTHQESILKNWMKNVNIFEKEFLFVPISLSSHWFLAVMCFSYLNVDSSILEGASESILKKVQLNSGECVHGANNVPVVLPKKPCIIILDSMSKYTREHMTVFRTLWAFLTAEIGRQSNHQNVINFTAATMPGCVPSVPQQTNKTDCGLYVLKYFDSFFTNPIVSFEFPFEPRKKWFDTTLVPGMRQHIYKEIVRITKTYFPQNIPDIPVIEFKSESTDEEEYL